MKLRDRETEIMDRSHPRWEEFLQRLEGPEGCDFREDELGNVTWRCVGGNNKDFAIKILKDMGGIDIEKSLAFFDDNGGHCDCEILFNVASD